MGNSESAPAPRTWYWGDDGRQYGISDNSLMPTNKYVLPPAESPPAPGFQSENEKLESVKTEKPDFDLSMEIDIVDNLAEFIKAKPDELQENKVKLETENPNLEQDLLADNLAEFKKAEFIQEEIDFNE